MQQKKRSMLVWVIVAVFMAAGFFLPGLSVAGDLEPPDTDTPGPTMKTLDEIPPTWSQTLTADERFVLVLNDAAVLDKETGLVWAKDANISVDPMTWADALNYCQDLETGDVKGWRLPTVEELASLVNPGVYTPSLPSGHPFENVQNKRYWSSDEYEGGGDNIWSVHMSNGNVDGYPKANSYYVWPVRGGN